MRDHFVFEDLLKFALDYGSLRQIFATLSSRSSPRNLTPYWASENALTNMTGVLWRYKLVWNLCQIRLSFHFRSTIISDEDVACILPTVH
jgi:hypothetical protein